MARVTVEDCLAHVDNRFALVVLAAKRARQIAQGGRPVVQCNNKPIVTALREIAAGKVSFNEDVRSMVNDYIRELALQATMPGGY